MERQIYNKETFHGERALFNTISADIIDSVFADGESPLKESKDILIRNSIFEWKYPLWHCDGVNVENTNFTKDARAGVWYTKNINIENSLIDAPKNFRRCENLKLKNVSFTNAEETLWKCNNVELCGVSVNGDYFALDLRDGKVDNLHLAGSYSFDGAKNVEVTSSTLISKDAFWNSENVTVRDSFISGEYLGWNSKNLTFINCTIESLQGLCCIENLKLENCKLINTTLAFEHSVVNADILSKVDSILNPEGGFITLLGVNTLILEEDQCNTKKTIIDGDVKEELSLAPWRKK